ncbi:hypothetical protein HRR83_002409 [Exophiala dermatitidis]|uniref:Uncharacterized protein n=2 Tax=Exophiala dermatitidis TaxID=5970 RepID=H6C135_EXODN|nr:uncharacterized protein HMPREF1120_04587 [Exophiala dermatitidis NIH/UT8656]KAJ4524289.1 hypothetical protein HRR74_002486 [Exophiala dermatitidis]EHY56506.1 hypothetical protein HMPREF1120_04587 [Exophiala dermatitidis NIH/UT8656]KAJ4525438.1 hypothetical protein HRR73_002168 [Exophiala dermatitidis]KAJ4536753.1 hypothetical protein HRR76_004780 [Exophiala dermatitidis]KAJ4555644.1 hypothetical protein HRR77_001573 [Exophiala dermatitidis]
MWPFNSSQNVGKDDAATSTIIQSEPPTSQVQPVSEPEPEPVTTESPVGFTGWPNERLSIPFVLRAPTLMMASFGCGFILGSSQGATKGAYRYRAENAHRLPTTQTGWFLYQKSKNYHAMLSGIKEGSRFGAVCMGWATLFMVTEEMVDLSRTRLLARKGEDVATGQRDAGSTVIAGMTLAGFYSWKRGLDHFAAARTARAAFKFSLAYGLLQDLMATIRGNPPAYIAWLQGKMVHQERLGSVD